MPPRGAEIRGIREFRRELSKIDGLWAKELRRVSKDVADQGALYSRREASALGGVHRHSQDAIRGYATANDAKVGVSAGKRFPEANVAFWGAKQRTGWYGGGQYRQSRGQQHPPWVGNNWVPARRGQGPYAINEALAKNLDRLLAMYLDMVEDMTREAFRNR